MFNRVPQFPEVLIYFVHPAIETAIADIKFILSPALALQALVTFPDLLKAVIIDITVEETFVFQVGTATPDIAASVYVGPEGQG